MKSVKAIELRLNNIITKTFMDKDDCYVNLLVTKLEVIDENTMRINAKAILNGLQQISYTCKFNDKFNILVS